MKALVTGGAGFIGRHLVRRLVAERWEVTVLDDLRTGDAGALPRAARFVHGSVLDLDLAAAQTRDVDVVFHLAAVASVARCNSELVASHAVNITGFVRLLEALAARTTRPKIVYASSAAVYGNKAGLARESDLPRPRSPYGADKLCMEHHAFAAWEVFGIPSFGLRFFNVYGPEQDPSSPYSGVISIFADRLLRNEGLVIHGDGRQTRDFVYVDDVVEALLRAGLHRSAGATVANVCTGQGTTVFELAELMAGAVGAPLRLSHCAARPGDIRTSVGDPTGLQKHLGLRPATSLSEGLRRLLAGRHATVTPLELQQR